MVATKETHIAKRRKELEQLYDELEAGQKEMEDGPLSQTRGEELEEKAKLAEEIQKEVEQYERIKKYQRTPKDPAVPAPRDPEDDDGTKGNGRMVQVQSMTPGDLFALSEEFQEFQKAGFPREFSQAMNVPTLFGPNGRVPLTPDRLKRVQEAIEKKTVPTIGPDVIVPYRDPDSVRIPEQLPTRTIRNLVRVVPITSNLVTYIVYSFTGEAAVVPEGEPKPENAADFDTASAPVVVIAKWIPVTNQQLEDVPSLSATINDELLYELAVAEEKELVWGDPDTGGLSGLLDPETNVPVIPTPDRGVDGDGNAIEPTNIMEAVLMGITDVTMRGGTPTAATIHPLDWESALIAKGTDGHYMWAIVTQANQRRLWGIELVPTLSMQDPTDGSRHLIVGDWIRGATLYDRQAANIAVGWINDQFIRNMRSILAEERIAWAVKRPHFFGQYETAAAAP